MVTLYGLVLTVYLPGTLIIASSLGKGGSPGGYSCISMNAEPPPWVPAAHLTLSHVGALESDSGWQDVPGKELGSHMAMENHGAGVSSK